MSISTEASRGPVSFDVQQDGPLKMVFEKGRQFKEAFAKNSKINISVIDSEGKVKYKRKVFPGDFFLSPFRES